ncbi:Holliday junction resolvase RuvX [Bartonella sp. TP]|uniref:Holliday junction resolvase RuvX n=1 Tax=Bartonella sp. TP TaxID=3057550 RepID=UPI0025B1DC12|nr:Holliday junction resolvase RuvX [Bartonella sp. TP]WJW79902.1 Holliday junction resolvase RuvX [Bartonella sp. TP]
MTCIKIEELAPYLQKDSTLAGLDLGSKTIGLAISDIGYNFAYPRPLLRRKKFVTDAALLLERLKAERVAAIVIGLPINMNGSMGPRVQSTRSFVSNMANYTELPFIFWDERLSTVAAERTLIEMDMSRKKRADHIDSNAACFILQGALDRWRAITTK